MPVIVATTEKDQPSLNPGNLSPICQMASVMEGVLEPEAAMTIVLTGIRGHNDEPQAVRLWCEQMVGLLDHEGIGGSCRR
jgi:hypothetical protein